MSLKVAEGIQEWMLFIRMEQQAPVKAASANEKLMKKVNHNLDLISASALFRDALINQVATAIIGTGRQIMMDDADFDNIFHFETAPYEDNFNTIGTLKVWYRPTDLLAERQRRFLAGGQTFEKYNISFQRPTNDGDLYKWIKNLPKSSSLRQLSTNNGDFSTAFCAINSLDRAGQIPFSSNNKRGWLIKNMHDILENDSYKTLYVFVPEGTDQNSCSINGKDVYFMSMSADSLQEIRSRSNRDDDSYDYVIQEALYQPNSHFGVGVEDFNLASGYTNNLVQENSVTDRTDNKNRESDAIADTNYITNKINSYMLVANKDPMFNTSKYTFVSSVQ